MEGGVCFGVCHGVMVGKAQQADLTAGKHGSGLFTWYRTRSQRERVETEKSFNFRG